MVFNVALLRLERGMKTNTQVDAAISREALSGTVPNCHSAVISSHPHRQATQAYSQPGTLFCKSVAGAGDNSKESKITSQRITTATKVFLRGNRVE